MAVDTIYPQKAMLSSETNFLNDAENCFNLVLHGARQFRKGTSFSGNPGKN